MNCIMLLSFICCFLCDHRETEVPARVLEKDIARPCWVLCFSIAFKKQQIEGRMIQSAERQDFLFYFFIFPF